MAYGRKAQKKARYKKKKKGRTMIPKALRGFVRTAGYYSSAPGSELKFHDLDLDDAVVTTNGDAITPSLNLIAQGVTESQRLGRKCTIQAISWRYVIGLPTTVTAAETSDTLRMIMYQDRQCNGAAATAVQILETADYQSFNNLAEKGRFNILMDRSVTLSSQGGGGAAGTSFAEASEHGSFYKKCNIPLEFNAATGAITEIRSNNVGVLLISKSGFMSCLGKIRVRFVG